MQPSGNCVGKGKLCTLLPTQEHARWLGQLSVMHPSAQASLNVPKGHVPKAARLFAWFTWQTQEGVNMASAAPGKLKGFCSESLSQADWCGYGLELWESGLFDKGIQICSHFNLQSTILTEKMWHTTLALYRYGVHMELVGEGRNKFHSSSTNMYKLTLLTRERAVSCISLLSYSLLSLKGKKTIIQSIKQTNKQPKETYSDIITAYSYLFVCCLC